MDGNCFGKPKLVATAVRRLNWNGLLLNGANNSLLLLLQAQTRYLRLLHRCPSVSSFPPSRASWYFVLAKERLTLEQQQEIEGMGQANQDLALAYELSQDARRNPQRTEGARIERLAQTSKKLPGD